MKTYNLYIILGIILASLMVSCERENYDETIELLPEIEIPDTVMDTIPNELIAGIAIYSGSDTLLYEQNAGIINFGYDNFFKQYYGDVLFKNPQTNEQDLVGLFWYMDEIEKGTYIGELLLTKSLVSGPLWDARTSFTVELINFGGYADIVHAKFEGVGITDDGELKDFSGEFAVPLSFSCADFGIIVPEIPSNDFNLKESLSAEEVTKTELSYCLEFKVKHARPCVERQKFQLIVSDEIVNGNERKMKLIYNDNSTICGGEDANIFLTYNLQQHVINNSTTIFHLEGWPEPIIL